MGKLECQFSPGWWPPSTSKSDKQLPVAPRVDTRGLYSCLEEVLTSSNPHLCPGAQGGGGDQRGPIQFKPSATA